MEGIEISLLQKPSIHVDGHAARLPYDKCLALLAYMLFHADRPLRRDFLAELLWPESGQDPRGNLRHGLHELRKILADDGHALVTTRDSLMLNRSAIAFVDVWHFERLSERAMEDGQLRSLELACEAYRGDLLPDLAIDDSIDFMMWLDGERLRLRCLAQEAVAFMTRGLIDQRRYAQAMGAAQRWLTLCPTDSEPCEVVLEIAIRTGQIGMGRALYNRHEQVLAQELGLRPSSRVAGLWRKLEALHSQNQEPSREETLEPTQHYQRRWLTVAAAAFTREALDREPEAIDDARRQVASIFRAYGALTEWLPTGEVVGFFGYPMASESQSARAILACQSAQRPLGQWVGYGVSIGWSMSDENRRADVMGRLLRSALRLADQAGAGHIHVNAHLISALTDKQRRQLNIHQVRDGVFDIGRLSSAPALSDFARHRNIPMLGRESELMGLCAWWEGVRHGHGGVAWITGEAGIGKTRLVSEFVIRKNLNEASVRLVACRPERMHVAYGALIDAIRRYAGIRQYHSSKDARIKLAERLGDMGLSRLRPFFESLLDIAVRESGVNPDVLVPDRVVAAVYEMFSQLARLEPLLIVIEDAHWLDESSRAVLSLLMERLHDRVGLLVTSRSGPRESCPVGVEYVLSPLGIQVSRSLMKSHIKQSGAMTVGLVDALVEMAGGIPLFIEEVALHWLERRGEGGVPNSLRGMLLERLEGLGKALVLAQVGSVLGRRFEREELAFLIDDPDRVHALWGVLSHSCLFLETDERAREVEFRHALIREAAYESMEPAERMRWHARIVETFQEAWSEQVADRLPELARHAELAGQWAVAAATWMRAAKRARDRGELPQALDHLACAETVAHYLNLVQSDAVAFEVAFLRGTVFLMLWGYGNREARASFEQARSIGLRLDPKPDLFPVLWGIWIGGRGPDEANIPPDAHLNELWAEAQRDGRSAYRVMAHAAYANNMFFFARFHMSVEHAEACIKLASELPEHLMIEHFGEDPATTSRAFLSWSHWFLGQEEDAVRIMQENLAHAERLGHAHTISCSLVCAAVLRFFQNKPEEVALIIQRLEVVADRYDAALWKAAGMIFKVWIQAAPDDTEMLALADRPLEMCSNIMPSVEPLFLWIAADAARRSQCHSRKMVYVERAMEVTRYNEDRYLLPILYALQAEEFSRQGDDAQSEKIWHMARDMALEQGSIALDRYCFSKN